MKHLSAVLALCVAVALVGCGRKKDASSDNSAQAPALPPNFDVCTLITKDEVAAIEGSPVKDVKPTDHASGGLRFAQCFYTTEEFSRSVSLAATLTDSSKGPGRSVKQYWKETFGKYQHEGEKEKDEDKADKEKRESLREKNQERGEEGEGAPPKKVTGIGEEAYWLGNRVGGALYVLKSEALLRISVGGPDPEQGKIDKCKALAEKALARLQ